MDFCSVHTGGVLNLAAQAGIFICDIINHVEQILLGPSTVPDGTMNLVGGLRKAMATTGYSDVKEFQRVEVVLG